MYIQRTCRGANENGIYLHPRLHLPIFCRPSPLPPPTRMLSSLLTLSHSVVELNLTHITLLHDNRELLNEAH
jgi:hypothetical protein